MLISERSSSLGVMHNNRNFGVAWSSCKGHCHSHRTSSIDTGLHRTLDQANVITVSNDVCSGEIGGKRSVLHRACWVDFDKMILSGSVDDKLPAHGGKILISRNDTQQADGLSEEHVKGDLFGMSITNVGVRFGLDGPEVLPVVILPQFTNEA